MKPYFFVGSYCEIDGGRVKLERFGQRIELPDELAATVVRGGGAVLPEAKFDEIGFTEQELKQYAYPGQRLGAPEAFNAKVVEAHRAFCEYREQVKNGGIE
jgi:hypothetical protein